jgi:hypothetical protein
VTFPSSPTASNACSDEAQLETWVRRAIVVESIDDVFA